MIDLTRNEEQLERTVQRARERGIIIPTFAQMRDPHLTPTPIVEGLAGVGLWDLHPLNLFRITWKNEPTPHGGGRRPALRRPVSAPPAWQATPVAPCGADRRRCGTLVRRGRPVR